MNKKNEKEKKEKKGFISKIVDKLDKKLEDKAKKTTSCDCSDSDKKGGSSCC